MLRPAIPGQGEASFCSLEEASLIPHALVYPQGTAQSQATCPTTGISHGPAQDHTGSYRTQGVMPATRSHHQHYQTPSRALTEHCAPCVPLQGQQRGHGWYHRGPPSGLPHHSLAGMERTIICHSLGMPQLGSVNPTRPPPSPKKMPCTQGCSKATELWGWALPGEGYRQLHG